MFPCGSAVGGPVVEASVVPVVVDFGSVGHMATRSQILLSGGLRSGWRIGGPLGCIDMNGPE